MLFTIRVLSTLTALLTWAASPGWTSAVTCCNIYREYHVPVELCFLVFTLSYQVHVHRFWSSLTCLSYEKVIRSNSRSMWMALFAQFCLILFRPIIVPETPVSHCPRNKKCGTDYNVKYYWTRGLVKIGPSNSLWVVQHLCDLSLAACSPLKPPKETPRLDKLNQVMI